MMERRGNLTKKRIVTTGGAWYTLSGMKLRGEPTTKGMYILNGKKVVVK